MNKNLRVVPGMIFLLFVTLTEAAAQYEIQTTPVRTHRGYIHLQDGTILKGRYAYSASSKKSGSSLTTRSGFSTLPRYPGLPPGDLRNLQAQPPWRSA